MGHGDGWEGGEPWESDKHSLCSRIKAAVPFYSFILSTFGFHLERKTTLLHYDLQRVIFHYLPLLG